MPRMDGLEDEYSRIMDQDPGGNNTALLLRLKTLGTTSFSWDFLYLPRSSPKLGQKTAYSTNKIKSLARSILTN